MVWVQTISVQVSKETHQVPDVECNMVVAHNELDNCKQRCAEVKEQGRKWPATQEQPAAPTQMAEDDDADAAMFDAAEAAGFL